MRPAEEYWFLLLLKIDIVIMYMYSKLIQFFTVWVTKLQKCVHYTAFVICKYILDLFHGIEKELWGNETKKNISFKQFSYHYWPKKKSREVGF